MTSRATIRITAAGLALFAAVLVAGCTPSAEPVASPTPSATVPSSGPSPTLTQEEIYLSQIPDAAKGDDLLSAVEMAKFFVQLDPGLYMGDDPGLYAYLSLPECDFCSSSLESSAASLARGETQYGGEFVLSDRLPESVIDIDTGTALVGVWLTEQPYEVRTDDGSVVKSRGARELKVALALVRTEGLWRVHAGEFVDA